jgi:hypothetical protein
MQRIWWWGLGPSRGGRWKGRGPTQTGHKAGWLPTRAAAHARARLQRWYSVGATQRPGRVWLQLPSPRRRQAGRGWLRLAGKPLALGWGAGWAEGVGGGSRVSELGVGARREQGNLGRARPGTAQGQGHGRWRERCNVKKARRWSGARQAGRWMDRQARREGWGSLQHTQSDTHNRQTLQGAKCCLGGARRGRGAGTARALIATFGPPPSGDGRRNNASPSAVRGCTVGRLHCRKAPGCCPVAGAAQALPHSKEGRSGWGAIWRAFGVAGRGRRAPSLARLLGTRYFLRYFM